MKDEIKEKQLKEVLYGLDYIGNKIKNDDGKLELGVNNCKILLDYITNLQTIEQQYSAILSENAELENKITNLQEENERLKENNQSYQEEMARTWKIADDYESRNEKSYEYLDKFIPNEYGVLLTERQWNYAKELLKGEDKK